MFVGPFVLNPARIMTGAGFCFSSKGRARMRGAGLQMADRGRPTSYDPAFVDEVVPFMGQGYSITAFAGHIGVARQTLYNWMEAHPDFLDAIKRGEAASAVWWENCLRQNAMTGEGNATAAIFGLKNRATEDWRDRKDLDHTSSDGSMTPKPDRIIIRAAEHGNGDD